MTHAHAAIPALPIAQRHAQIDLALQEHAGLWRAQPYKLAQPAWRERYPQLATDLLRLGDAQVDQLMTDAKALTDFVARSVPAVGRLAPLIDLPDAHRHPIQRAAARSAWDIPGRKATQVEAFAAALGVPRAPVTEWCAGKGHLGRRLALECGVPVSSLEIDVRLCEAGRALARRARADRQRFVTVDVLGPFVRGQLRGCHAVALHACGDLHAALLHGAADEGAAAVHLAACCYHKTADATRASLSGEGSLQLTHEDLRLATSDAVTAGPREVQAGRLRAAWLLGLRALTGVDRLSMRSPGPPLDADWRRGGFRRFCEQAAAANGVSLDAGIDWPAAERDAHLLEHRARRMNLPRQAFRRMLELWLAFDRARFLEQRGYRATLSTFCPRALTPRNLLIAAER